MAEINGQLVTCDRCGTQIFRRAIGEGEADGGYTRWNKFEEFPEGWEWSWIPTDGSCNTESIRTCPACTNLWRNVINEHFLRGTKYHLEKQTDSG